MWPEREADPQASLTAQGIHGILGAKSLSSRVVARDVPAATQSPVQGDAEVLLNRTYAAGLGGVIQRTAGFSARPAVLLGGVAHSSTGTRPPFASWPTALFRWRPRPPWILGWSMRC